MKMITKTALALAFGLASVNSFAGSESGLYLGGSIGQAGVEAGEGDFKLDESDSAYKIFAGYNFGIIPMLDLAVEADYRDFGKFETGGGAVSSELKAIDLYGLVGVNFGPAGVFAKVGYSRTDVDTRVDEFRASDSDNNMTYGIGAKVGLGSIKFRAEYEMFDIKDTDTVYMASLGVAYTF
ncbi:opacity protein-like surface antigen [Alteromonadaceae bacterium 2753L.S.0a.02]|nr:opacity protein-like surface antigen [Alteromonadaceae bacterium 2753L.S.0a.02]